MQDCRRGIDFLVAMRASLEVSLERQKSASTKAEARLTTGKGPQEAEGHAARAQVLRLVFL